MRPCPAWEHQATAAARGSAPLPLRLSVSDPSRARRALVAPGGLVPTSLLQHAEAPGAPPPGPGASDAQQHFPVQRQRCPPAARGGPARAAPRGRPWRPGPAEAALVAEETRQKPSRPGKAVRGWGVRLKAWGGIALPWRASFSLVPLRTRLWHQPSFCSRCQQELRRWRAEAGRCPARQPLALKSLALDIVGSTCSYQPLAKPSAPCRETAEAQGRVRSTAARAPPPLEPWVRAYGCDPFSDKLDLIDTAVRDGLRRRLLRGIEW